MYISVGYNYNMENSINTFGDKLSGLDKQKKEKPNQWNRSLTDSKQPSNHKHSTSHEHHSLCFMEELGGLSQSIRYGRWSKRASPVNSEMIKQTPGIGYF